ncbi:hypothetical protein CPB83DRAFT_840242 [Crepidotus variabilis]|uniref:Uncharacterized protein n=1 Tax=Crepidotus variabilis TaxID=179855 RepID=A0A9P6JJ61_9AGAR|nr:hypothetical protein CPB83DRAFT_840242 [Crepidotus variabilis]
MTYYPEDNTMFRRLVTTTTKRIVNPDDPLGEVRYLTKTYITETCVSISDEPPAISETTTQAQQPMSPPATPPPVTPSPPATPKKAASQHCQVPLSRFCQNYNSYKKREAVQKQELRLKGARLLRAGQRVHEDQCLAALLGVQREYIVVSDSDNDETAVSEGGDEFIVLSNDSDI